MSFTKITNAQLNSRGATTLPNQPQIGAAALKAEFDAPAKQIVAPAFNNLVDELQATTSAASLGAAAPAGKTFTSVQGAINDIETDLATLDAASHSHSNKAYIDKISEDSDGNPLYDGNPIGQGATWGGITGTLADQTDLATALSGKSDTGHTHTKSEISDFPSLATVATSGSYNDLSNKPTIPTVDQTYDGTSTNAQSGTAVASAISTKSNVAWSQTVTTGQKIAVVTIDGTPTDVYAPTGGGGGGGAVDSVNNQTGTVVLNVGDMMDATFTSMAENDAIVRNGSNKWVNVPLPAVALSGDYDDLSNKPTIPAAQVNSDWSAVSGVAQILNKPTIPDELDDLTDVVITGTPAEGQALIVNSSGKFANANLPTGGHTMIAVANDISTIQALANGNDNYVINAYTAKRWSNVDGLTLYTTAAKDTDTIGDWEDNWTSVGASREGWLWHSALHDILADDTIEIEPIFDVGGGEVVSVYAYRIDDDVQLSGVDGGAIAIKLNAAITNPSGVKIGFKLSTNRTANVQLTPIPS